MQAFAGRSTWCFQSALHAELRANSRYMQLPAPAGHGWIDRTFGWAAVASGSNRPLIVLCCTPNLAELWPRGACTVSELLVLSYRPPLRPPQPRSGSFISGRSICTRGR